MFENIDEIEKKYGLIISKRINDEKIILSIFNSLELKEEDYNLNDSNILVFIGIYYRHVKKDNENAKKYYLMAIEKGNAYGMNNLGYLYYDMEKDYENAKKYYLMAVEKGNDCAMYNLGYLYYNIEKDYENAKKYYLMAVEKGDDHDAMYNLGCLYYDIKKDYNNAKKYWLMAYEKGNDCVMNNIKRIMNNLELYISLKEMINKTELIENEIKELKKVKKVNEYENKLMYFRKLNNIKYCEICFENDKLHLLMECGGHDICEYCFVKVEKCPYCRY
uniref:RING-type domain-containing protein n=1 Tax=viral metagenome TaxID=1070528 RepID=A0A6C0H5C5_9ZZZZ